jgi:predicted nucleic acid-binding protein
MKVVIADTSPLNYLILVDAVEILPRLYGRVTIPDVVLQELTDEDAPQEVKAWARLRPEWIEVQATPFSADPSLEDLDPGEQAAILLALRQAEVCS